MGKLSDTMKPVLHIAETKNNGSPTAISNVNMTGWGHCSFLLGVGDLDTTLDAKVQESDDGGSTWSDVSGKAISQLSASDDESILAIEVAATELSAATNLVRLLVTVGNGATGAELAVIAVLSNYSSSASAAAQADLEEVVD